MQELRVRSTPPEAAVTIDGAEKGKTPIDVKLPVGSHDLKLMLEGYEPVEGKVDLRRRSRWS